MSAVAVPKGIYCVCPCHNASPLVPCTGVSVLDPVETVTACERCIKHHCAALMERRIWDEPAPVREVSPWVDSDSRGEGAEA